LTKNVGASQAPFTVTSTEVGALDAPWLSVTV
jgi:hypothetical protein